MKKWLFIVIFCCLPSLVQAQTIAAIRPSTVSASLTDNTCTGSATPQTGCVAVNLGGYKFVAVQLTGTWTGTVTFEISVDGTTWVTQNVLPSTGTQTVVTTSTGNGVWFATAQANMFRARFSTASSGTVVVTLRATL